MQVMRTIRAMQTGGHKISWYRQHRTRPCKEHKDGAPTVSEWERKTTAKGWATRRDAAMEGQHYPYPPDVLQKIDAANKALVPTERYAQQVEKIINGELQADKKR